MDELASMLSPTNLVRHNINLCLKIRSILARSNALAKHEKFAVC